MKEPVKWRWCSALIVTICGCSSSGTLPRPIEDPATDEESVHPSTSRDALATSQTRHVPDGGVMSLPDASSASSSATSDASISSSDVGTSWASPDDASAIEQPTIEEVSVDELCDGITTLEGRIVDVDLATRVVVGEWLEGPTSERGGDGGASDADVCRERFAAFVIPCRGSVLVASSPTFVFGEGPIVGGERVSLGCWETGCQNECYPESPNQIGKVRARVSAVVNAAFDEELGSYVGHVRVNGVDVPGMAAIEVLARL